MTADHTPPLESPPHPTSGSPANGHSEVLFESAYGAMPKFILYVVVPVLLGTSVFLLVGAIWFDLEIELARNLTLTPRLVAYVFCPLMWFLAAMIGVAEVHHRLHPQRVVATTDGLWLPAKRFSTEEVFIHWENLDARMAGYSNYGYDFYEITCHDHRNAIKVRVQSMLFRNFDNFAALALVVGNRRGEDWSIAGFLPGTRRGKE